MVVLQGHANEGIEVGRQLEATLPSGKRQGGGAGARQAGAASSAAWPCRDGRGEAARQRRRAKAVNGLQEDDVIRRRRIAAWAVLAPPLLVRRSLPGRGSAGRDRDTVLGLKARHGRGNCRRGHLLGREPQLGQGGV